MRLQTLLALLLLLGPSFVWASSAEATCCCGSSVVSAPCAGSCEMAPSSDCRGEEGLPSTSGGVDATREIARVVAHVATAFAVPAPRLRDPYYALRAYEMTPLLRKSALII